MYAKITIEIEDKKLTFSSTEKATAFLMKYNQAPENQKIFIEQQLLKHKTVHRNFALSHWITRLGALIANLKEDGYKIEGEWEKNEFGEKTGDYFYTLIEGKK